MKFKDWINDEYFTRIKNPMMSIGTEVFVNPTSKDFRDLPDVLRFIADMRDKKVYVWSAVDAFHKDVWKKIKKPEDKTLYIGNKYLMIGTLRKKGSKYQAYLEYEDEDMDYSNFKWMEEYYIKIPK